VIFSARNYASPACFGKVMPKNRRGPVFATRCITGATSAVCIPEQRCYSIEGENVKCQVEQYSNKTETIYVKEKSCGLYLRRHIKNRNKPAKTPTGSGAHLAVVDQGDVVFAPRSGFVS